MCPAVSLYLLIPLLLMLANCANIGVVGDDEANILKSYWNSNYNSTPLSFNEWISGHHARLYMVDAWWSQRNSSIHINIFTTMTLDRIHMLEALCQSYMGPVSAAVYISVDVETYPYDFTSSAGGRGTRRLKSARRRLGEGAPELAAPIADAREKLQDLFTRMEEQSTTIDMIAAALRSNNTPPCCCQLKMALMAERLADPHLAYLMPTNAMRNVAMLMVNTPLSIMLDVDLSFGRNFNELVQNSTWINGLLQGTHGAPQPVMYIPPAFEAKAHHSLNAAKIIVEISLQGGKQTVSSLWKLGILQAFQIDICLHCHGAFNHTRWMESDVPYTVKYTQGFEPWGILNRFLDPGYDERFRGWLYNKQTHVEALAQKHNFVLKVLPDVWAVHRPHKKIASRKLAKPVPDNVKETNTDVMEMLKVITLPDGTNASAYSSYRKYVDNLRYKARTALAARQPYEPQLNPQFLHCKKALPWWGGVR
ncbi:hypothetical protein VaNZ11_006477 [Volvox africanus]|uniref:Uncharacterized protein n=1 Tax=Volvox africanus TaxID=51714 RepID=A0ABQ5S0S0_9CHLO|nr:hypothetical protein VaNZ11_006477 [Volvox africanus]